MMTDGLLEVTIGDPLPDLIVSTDNPMLMAYGAATWDWHRVHYDADSARAAGLDGPIVDGQMFGALIARQIRAWAGPRARFCEMVFYNRKFAVAGVRLTFRSEIANVSYGETACRLEVATTALDDARAIVHADGISVIEVPS